MTGSIVDYLNGQGQASDFATRKKLAEQNGITGYTGSAQQNTSLLSTLSSSLPKAPIGKVLGASTDTMEYGAGGRGEFKSGGYGTPEEQAQAAALMKEATGFGVPSSELGNFASEPTYRIPVLSDEEGKGFAGSQGLKGLQDNAFAGLTRAEAQQKAAKIKQGYLDNSNPNTSFSFNPETIAGAKKTLAGFNSRIQEVKNNSWNHPNTIGDKTKGIITGTANELAKLFNTKEDFNAVYNSSPDFKQQIDSFVASGGDVNGILAKIQAPGLQNNQSTSEYLSTQAPQNGTQAEQDAFTSLIPERELAQREIARIANIPQQYHDLYFGTPEQAGILEQKRVQAEEAKRIVEQKARDSETNLRAQADLAIQKNNADLQIENTKIEENRLASRNYMTGMLAKLGALNTTGQAPLVLATLEQKYNQESRQLQDNANYARKNVESQLMNGVNDIEIQRDESILTVQSDLTKDRETVAKEVQKIQQASDKQIYSITDKAAGELRTRTEAYTKAAKALAIKNAKAYLKTVKKYSPGAPGGSFTPTERRNIERGGLSDNTKEVKNFFVNTDPKFKAEWNRNVANGANAKPTIQNITNSYNQWKSANTKKSKSTTSVSEL